MNSSQVFSQFEFGTARLLALSHLPFAPVLVLWHLEPPCAPCTLPPVLAAGLLSSTFSTPVLCPMPLSSTLCSVTFMPCPLLLSTAVCRLFTKPAVDLPPNGISLCPTAYAPYPASSASYPLSRHLHPTRAIGPVYSARWLLTRPLPLPCVLHLALWSILCLYLLPYAPAFCPKPARCLLIYVPVFTLSLPPSSPGSLPIVLYSLHPSLAPIPCRLLFVLCHLTCAFSILLCALRILTSSLPSSLFPCLLPMSLSRCFSILPLAHATHYILACAPVHACRTALCRPYSDTTPTLCLLPIALRPYFNLMNNISDCNFRVGFGVMLFDKYFWTSFRLGVD